MARDLPDKRKKRKEKQVGSCLLNRHFLQTMSGSRGDTQW